MQIHMSHWLENVDLKAEDQEYHKHNGFFDTKLLSKPEFMYRNHLIDLKESEIKMLEEHLLEREETSALSMRDSQLNIADKQAPAKGKPDPKKDAKGKPQGKGAVQQDDKNAPKNITVEYPEITREPNFLVIEKSYRGVKKAAET